MNGRPRPIDPEPARLSDEQLALEAGLPESVLPLTELARSLLEIRHRYRQPGSKPETREEILRRYDLWDDPWNDDEPADSEIRKK